MQGHFRNAWWIIEESYPTPNMNPYKDHLKLWLEGMKPLTDVYVRTSFRRILEVYMLLASVTRF